MRVRALHTMVAGIIAGALAGTVLAGTVIDRIAVIVGKHVVKASEIDRDLRVTQFLNREPLHEDAAAKKQSAERLIDQQIIRQELTTGGYARASDADARSMLQQIRQDTYRNSEANLAQALRRYSLTEDQLVEQLVWQLTVLRFIDQRFRAGVLVTDEEIRRYYDQHRTEFKGAFEDSADAARASLEGVQINQQFERWLTEARGRNHIEYREEAFR